MNCKTCQNQLSDYADQSLSPDKTQAIDEHLRSCETCAALLHEMQIVVQNAGDLERRQPPEHLWTSIAAELDAPRNGVFKKRFFEIIESVKGALTSPGFAVKGAAAFALLLLGVFIGRTFFPSSDSETQFAENSADFELLNQRAQQYLEKSKLVLTSVAHTEFETDEPVEIDLEKRISAQLLQESAYLQEHLPQRKNERLRRLMTQLDMILSEIAELQDQEDFESIELIRDGIESTDLILQINLNRLQEELIVPVKSEKDQLL